MFSAVSKLVCIDIHIRNAFFEYLLCGSSEIILLFIFSDCVTVGCVIVLFYNTLTSTVYSSNLELNINQELNDSSVRFQTFKYTYSILHFPVFGLPYLDSPHQA